MARDPFFRIHRTYHLVDANGGATRVIDTWTGGLLPVLTLFEGGAVPARMTTTSRNGAAHLIREHRASGGTIRRWEISR